MDIEPIRRPSNPTAQAGILPPAQASVAASFRPAAADASRRLSEALLQRYGVVPAPADGLEPVHLQPPAGQVVLQATNRYALHLASHIRLTFVQRAASASRAATPAETGQSVDMRLPGLNPERQSERQIRIKTLVERLFARGERQSSITGAEPVPTKSPPLSSGTPEAAAVAASHLSDPGDQPLRMVLRKPAPVMAPDAAQTPAEAQTDAIQVTEAQWRRPAVPPSMAPIDIQQITQQVIQTIDRKIIGQRERFGRI